jgi:hypothetical protein
MLHPYTPFDYLKYLTSNPLRGVGLTRIGPNLGLA